MTGQLRQAAMTHARESFEARIRRFPRHYRRRLRKLASGSKPLTDLLYSFPAAAFVLAAIRLAPERIGAAIVLVKTGAPLPTVAATLDLPLWTRRLPPEAFARPFGSLPGGDDFSRRIVNLLPQAPEAAPTWLDSVAFGHEACDSALALWLAGRKLVGEPRGESIPLLPIAAFAWFSTGATAEIAAKMIERPWHASMRLASAALEARIWLEKVVLDYCLEPHNSDGGWLKQHKASGYRFIPIGSPEELREEGDKMSNCVATYARKAATGACLLYSVRRGGKRVATMEIVPAPDKTHMAMIAQIAGYENAAVPEDIRRAAEGWLAKRGRYPGRKPVRMADLPVRASRWHAVWQPYCAAKPQFGALLAQPEQAIARLDADLRELEKWREEG